MFDVKDQCLTCQHKRHPQGGWCYMFADAPTRACAQHTDLDPRFDPSAMAMPLRFIRR